MNVKRILNLGLILLLTSCGCGNNELKLVDGKIYYCSNISRFDLDVGNFVFYHFECKNLSYNLKYLDGNVILDSKNFDITDSKYRKIDTFCFSELIDSNIVLHHQSFYGGIPTTFYKFKINKDRKVVLFQQVH